MTSEKVLGASVRLRRARRAVESTCVDPYRPILTRLQLRSFNGGMSIFAKLFGLKSESAANSTPTTVAATKPDPRRFKRVNLVVDVAERLGPQSAQVLTQIAGATAKVIGENLDAPVVDLSHNGLALKQHSESVSSASRPWVIGQSYELEVALGQSPSFRARGKLARFNEMIVAFEFEQLSADGRVSVDRFLDAKLVGLNMRAVDRAFFHAGQDFDFWYSGPRDTNFILWFKNAQLSRAQVQVGDKVFWLKSREGETASWEADPDVNMKLEPSDARKVASFALDAALQIRGGGEPIAALVKHLTSICSQAA